MKNHAVQPFVAALTSASAELNEIVAWLTHQDLSVLVVLSIELSERLAIHF